MQTSPPNSQTVHRISMLGDLDKDCKTLEAESNLLIRCDNATVVAYINKQGGTKSIPLCLHLWDMIQWCLKHNIHIHAALATDLPPDECLSVHPNPTWMHLST
jgi:hypothetical protein